MTGAYDAVRRIYKFIGALSVIGIIVIVIASIVLRELFGIPLVWANEAAITLFVWTVFVGGGMAFADNAHIRFTIVTDRLPRAGRRTADLLVTYVGMVLFVGLFVTSIYLTYLFRDQRFTTLPISAAWQWAALPTGLFLAIMGWVRYGKWTWNAPDLKEKALVDMPVL